MIKSKKLLSIHYSHDPSITYIVDNKVEFTIAVDRWTKIKTYAYCSPEIFRLIQNIEFDELVISCIATHEAFWGYWSEAIASVPKFQAKVKKAKLYNCEGTAHHLFHAWGSVLTSPFKDAYIIVADMGGKPLMPVGTGGDIIRERESTYHYKDGVMTEDLQLHGCFGRSYTEVTQYLYNKPFEECRDDAKLMALSLYGNPIYTTDTQIRMIGQQGIKPKLILTDKKAQDVAASGQKLFEEGMDFLFENTIKDKNQNIILTGGCAQNILFNSKALKKYPNLHVDPFCYDVGMSLGSANYFCGGQVEKINNLYLGYKHDLETDIDIFKKDFNIIDVNYADVAKILHKDPVAIFQSRSEQGQRALGNRSLLANINAEGIEDKINRIKKREWYRPFATSILEEDAPEWFDMLGRKSSPYMMFVFDIKKDKLKYFNIAKSLKNDCRIQTVNKEQNEHYYNLINTFKSMYGLPLIMNTSLNLPVNAVVETLRDLKFTMEASDLNYSYLPELGKLICKKK